jgi:hypothetical protein
MVQPAPRITKAPLKKHRVVVKTENGAEPV